MIYFLFGTWGAGKSYVGNQIEARYGIPHFEADLEFDVDMKAALDSYTFHKLDLSGYYQRVILQMQSYQRRYPQFVVNQAIYREKYRHQIFTAFFPDIKFIWVQTPHEALQKARLAERARKETSVVLPSLYSQMAKYWEEPRIAHLDLFNDKRLEQQLETIFNPPVTREDTDPGFNLRDHLKE